MYLFKAFLFEGKKTAQQAFELFKDFAPEEYVWIDDVAVVSRNENGTIRVHSTWAQDDSEDGADTNLGALTGGLIGILFRPGGVLAGEVMGGSLGALFGAGGEVTFDNPRLGDFAAYLGKNTSALILVGEEAALDDFVSAVEPFGGNIIETNLNDNDIKTLRKALKKVA